MNRKITIFLLCLFIGFTAFSQNNAVDLADADQNLKSAMELKPNIEFEQNHSPMGLLYDNGPLINSPGTGSGGADESVLQSTSLSMSSLGFNVSVNGGYWFADDFTVTDAGGWDLSSLVFYAYQTNSPTTSTLTACHLMVYDDDPSLPTANVVWGDAVTDVLTSTTWSDIYRVTETTSGAVSRPIMSATCDVNFHLDQGTYWLVWQLDGSLASGPWGPPITINGQSSTGNALQSGDGITFFAMEDSGQQQGAPFLVYGSAAATTVPVSNWAVIFSFLVIVVVVSIRFVFIK